MSRTTVEPARSGWAVLRSYRRSWLGVDLVAGLTVGAMLVPQSMAYAELAGAPAATGLYASILAPIAYALVGSSRHLGTGPEPGTAILAASTVAVVAGSSADSERYLALMAATGLLVGAIAGIAWLLRLGFVANLLSRPVLVGYITGVGLVLISSQISPFTGIPIEASEFFPRVRELLGVLGGVDGVTFAVGGLALLVLLGMRRFTPRLPGALVAVVLATAASWLLDLSASGVAIVGEIPAGIPTPALPAVSLADLRGLFVGAIGITLVGYTDNVLTGRAVGTQQGYRIDPSQELAGLAVANAAAGVLQGMPVSSSASRSIVPASLGSRTSLVGIIGALVVVATLLVARGALALVPRAALAAVILSAAVAIIDIDGFRSLWRVSRVEFGLAAVTSLGVMVFDVLGGVLIAVGLSVLVAFGRIARPSDAVLGERDDLDGWVSVDAYDGTRQLPGLLVYRFDAPLFFANAERFRARLLQALDDNPGTEQWVVLALEGVVEIDSTALDVLAELMAELETAGVDVIAVARSSLRTLDRLRRAGLLEPGGPIRVFGTINAAVMAFESQEPPGPAAAPDG